MTLELIQVVPQIESAVQHMKSRQSERKQRLETAIRIFHSQDPSLQQLRDKLSAAKITWLTAGIAGGLNNVFPLPPCPPEVSVLGVDGSHLEFQRDSPLACYLLNMGMARICYGKNPEALLQSYGKLYSTADDLVLADPGGSMREQRIEGVLLGIKRAVEELGLARQLLTECPAGIPVVAMLDGTLTLWGLSDKTYPEFVSEIFLERGFLGHMDALNKLSTEKTFSIASFISFPASAEVINLLRVA
ncbi:MAG: hypothetical protein U1D67_10190, partial [Dehalococcoidia bacterium]|nr:hypothetical protein [Dehalococcoidia bacterium]